MTDLILIFAFILGVQYSNPFWVHGHVHEEGYETAEKKRLRDLKREASRMG